MKKFAVVLLSVLMLALIVACKQEVSVSTGYSTPTITGSVSIPDSAGLSAGDLWVKVVDPNGITRHVGKVNSDGNWVVTGLAKDTEYSVLITSEEPLHENAKDVSRASTKGYGGWLSNITAAVGDANNVGSVKVKPLGTIKGVVQLDGSDDQTHYDTTVYIPGTSYIAMTDEDGTFALYNVPQATYTLRYTHDDYMSQMKSGVVLYSADDETSPTTTVSMVTLIKNAGTVKGSVLLSGANDSTGISIKLSNTTASSEGTTSSDGSFTIHNVVPGTYNAEISFPGYLSKTITGITVTAAQTTSLGDTITLTANGGNIAGTVSFNDGGSKEGVLVLANSTDSKYSYTTTTDSDGAYKIVNAFPGTYTLTLSKTGYAVMTKENVPVYAGQQTGIKEIVFSSEYGTVKGKVVDTSGNAIENAIVKIGETSIFTGSDGTFERTGIAVGIYNATVSKEGYKTVTLSQSVSVESSKTLNMGTTRLASVYGALAGKVTVNDGGSVSGITVTASNSDYTYTAKTDSNGAYTILDMQPDTYTVKAEADGYETATRNVSITADKSVACDVLALESKVGTLNVTVRYSDSTRTDGITVSIYDGERKVTEATTENSLTLTFEGIDVGSYTVVAEAEGYAASAKSEVSVASATEKFVSLTALSNKFGTVSGTVTDTKGNAIENALVKIGEISAFTDSDGRFEKTGIAIGDYSVKISKDGYSTLTLEQTIAVEPSITTNIGVNSLVSVSGAITGSVSLSNGNSSVGTIVVVENSDNRYTATVGTDGVFVIPSIVPGDYKISFTKSGYDILVVDNVAVSADSVIDLANTELLFSTGTISGRIVLENETIYSNATVLAVNSADDSIRYSSLTAADGTYYIGNVAPGTYSLQVSHEGYVSNVDTLVNVSAGNATSVSTITLASTTSTVVGKISLDGTEDNTGVTILLRASDESHQYSTTTDQGGNYTITRVIPGEYKLYASKGGFETKTMDSVVVETSTTKTIDSLSLAVAIRSIVGSVELEGKTDHSGALVTATNLADENKVYSAISNSSGVYTLAGMEPGEYRIIITCANYRTATLKTVDIIESSTLNIPLESMTLARGTVRGVATLEGRTSSEGILVQIIDTDYEAYTDANGEYSFYVPEGNYPGVRFSCDDFKTSSQSLVIALFADNTFPIENVELEATHVSVSGNVLVYQATDNSDVHVSFDDCEIAEVITGENGSYRFDHVPVGATYTLRFSRENAADVTYKFTTTPADVITIEEIKVVPDAAGIEGFVKLNSSSNNANVNVQINTGVETLKTTTDYSGYYYLGGIPTGNEFTLEFSKDGWTSTSTTLSSLEPLEVRTLDEIEIVDETAPVLNSIEINGGANVSGSRLVSVKINAEESGSGISQMRYCWDGNLEAASWVSYYSTPKIEIPSSENGNYTLTLEIRDAAGNVSSTSSSDSIELVGQITTIQPGILSGDNLHWQAKDNPIVVMGTVTVAKDDTLVIDPGVDVIFNGDYSIRVLGKIQAIGTETQPIVFDSSKNYLAENYQVDGFEGYDGYWGGILVSSDVFDVTDNGNYNYTFKDGSILSYCNIYDLSEGITGRVFIDHCRIETLKSALGYFDSNRFNGYLLNSYISGGVSTDDNWNGYTIFGNIFDGSKLLDEPIFECENHYMESWRDWDVANRWYEYGYDSDGNYISRSLYEFNFNGVFIGGRYNFVNNKIVNYNAIYLDPNEKVQFNTIESCRSLRIYNDGGDDKFKYNDIHDISDSILLAGTSSFTFSNFYNIAAEYAITVQSGTNAMDYGYNYWGDYTSELQSIVNYGSGNASFLYDGYYNTNLSIIDWTGFVSTPWDFVGFQGENLLLLNATFIREVTNYNEAKVGNPINISLSTAGDESIAYYRIGQSFEELSEASFEPYYGACTYAASDIDMDKIGNDGILDIYVQIRTDEGITSPVAIVSVGYDKPYVFDVKTSNGSKIDGQTITNDWTTGLEWSIHNAASNSDSYFYCRVFLDGVEIGSTGWNFWSDNNYTNCGWSNILDFSNMKNGEHKLSFETKDGVGDSSTTEVSFVVQHKTTGISDISLEEGFEVSEDMALEFTITTDYSTKLREIRVYSDDYLLAAKSFSGVSTYLLKTNISIENQYLQAGEHNLYIEVEDNAGDTARSEGIPFSVAGTVGAGPAISSVSIVDGDTVTGTGTVTVKASSDKGVRSLYVKADGKTLGADEGKYLSYSSEYDERTLQTSFSVYSLANGEHEIEIVVYDFSGVATTETRTIVVDKKFPTTSVTVSERHDKFIVKTTVGDVSNISSVIVSIGDEVLESYDVTSSTGRWTKEIEKNKAGLADGTYEVSVSIEDTTGDFVRAVSDNNVLIDSTKVFVENNLEGVTTFSGILSDADRLHWTTDMSPVVITGNITVSTGKTLVIDPGVEVLFEGDYSISVRGNIEARGTEDNPIRFRSSGSHVENHEGYYGTWKGIVLPESLGVSIDKYNCTFNSGSILEYCIIDDMSDGIVGRAYISSCIIKSTNYAIGNNSNWFMGVLLNSEISGSTKLTDTNLVFGNEFDGSSVSNSYFCYDRWDGNARFVNNLIFGYSGDVEMRIYYCVFEFNTIKDISGRLYLRRYEEDQNRIAKYNVISGISNTIQINSEFRSFQYSNITDLRGNPQIRVESSWSNVPSFDMRYNYWGSSDTSELERARLSSDNNVSFIHDGNDDSDLTIIEWDGFSTIPWEFAGYQGENFISIEASLVSCCDNKVKVGEDIGINLTSTSGNSIAYYRIAQTMEELKTAEYKAFDGTCAYPCSEIDMDAVKENGGTVNLCIQAMTGEGTTTPVTSLSFGYTVPYAANIKFNDALLEEQTITEDDGELKWSVLDDYYNTSRDYYVYYRMNVDGEERWSSGDWCTNSSTRSSTGIVNPQWLKNGEHVLTFVVRDQIGSESSTEFKFTVDRPVPHIVENSFVEGTEIGESESMTFTIRMADANHLRYVRVYSDGKLTATKYCDDYWGDEQSAEFSIASQYLQAGEHSLYIELEDYAGNIVKSEGIGFTVAGEIGAKPQFSMFTVDNGESEENRIKVNATATSAKGIKRLALLIDGTVVQEIGNEEQYDSSYETRSLELNRSIYSLTSGDHEVEVTAVDFSGTEMMEKKVFSIEKAFSNIKFSVNDRSNDFVVSMMLEDLANMNRVSVLLGEAEVTWQDISWCYDERWTWTPTLSKTETADGVYSVTIRVTDESGESFDKTIADAVVVNNTNPVVENNLEGVFTVGDVLTENQLHWTIENSPVVVTSGITVPQNKTLVIDPGVQVLFDGDYSILVRGYIDAVGTEENPIYFGTTRDRIENHVGFYDTWGGINISNESLTIVADGYEYSCTTGSRFIHCDIDDIRNGISGKGFISESEISSSSTALSDFRGALVNSKVYGGVSIYNTNPTYVFGNEFTGDEVALSYNYGRADFYFYDGCNNDCRFVNNKIKGYGNVDLSCYYSTMTFNTIDSCNRLTLRNEGTNSECISRYNVISNIRYTIELDGSFKGMMFSNIVNCKNDIVLNEYASWDRWDSVDFRYNYWGSNTAELEKIEAANKMNASFIHDGHDDNTKTIINWSDYVTEPWEFAGYQGDDFLSFEVSLVSSSDNKVKVGEDIGINLTSTSGNSIEYYRIAQTMDELKTAEYKAFDGTCAYPCSEIDMDAVKENGGTVNLYIQAMTGEGTTTPVTSLSFGYTVPYAANIKFNDALLEEQTITGDDGELKWSILDDCYNSSRDYYVYLRIIVDGEERWNSGDWYTNSSTRTSTGIVNPQWLKNGEHVLTFVARDQIGNESSTEFRFTVDRPVPHIVENSFVEGTEIGESESMTFTIKMADANHLRYVRVYSDGKLTATKYCDDGWGDEQSAEFSIASQYLQAGEHSLYIELEDYAGNIVKSEGISFTVAGEVGAKPQFSVFTVDNGESEENRIKVNATATSAKGIKRLALLIDGVVVQEIGNEEYYDSSYDTRSLELNRSVYSFTSGDHEVEVTAVDFSGAEMTEKKVFSIEKEFSNVEFSVNDRSSDFVVSMMLEDLTNMNRVSVLLGEAEVTWQDISWCGDERWTWMPTVSKTETADGVYSVTVRVTDESGESFDKTIADAVVVNNTNPVIENNLEGVYTVGGLLAENQLHWTIENSPVVVTSGITVPQNKTLVIDPGVQVLFDGDYSILVRGYIDAVGTEDDPICFGTTRDRIGNHVGFYDTWGGINISNDSLTIVADGYEYSCTTGSRFIHCDIDDIRNGISGKGFISESEISSSNTALADFRGALVNSKVYGGVSISNASPTYVFGNEFTGDEVNLDYNYGRANFYFYDGWNGDCRFVNNEIKGYGNVDLSCYESTMTFNTIDDCYWLTLRNENSNSSCISRYNVISNIRYTIELDGSFKGLTFSNIVNCSNDIVIRENASWNRWDSVDFRYNYWGSNTPELEELEAADKINTSFIYDGYDDNTRTTIDWTDYVTEPWEFAGYQRNGFVEAKAALVQTVSGVNEVVAGSPLQIRLTMQTEGVIDEYRIAQSMDDIVNATWSPYTGDLYISDYVVSDTGKVDMLVQIKTTEGNTSSIMSVDISSDIPKVTSTTVTDGQVISGDGVQYFYATIYDASNSMKYTTYLDGEMKYDRTYDNLSSGTYAVLGGYPWWGDEDCVRNGAVIDPTLLKNGEHNITIKLYDGVGNESTKVVHFTIERTLPSLLSMEFVNGTELDSNTSLDLKFAVADAAHVKEIRVVSDGYCLTSTEYADNESVTISENISLSTNYLKAGDHELYLEIEDYAGNITMTETYSFSVDTIDVAPTISGFEVTDNQVFSDFSNVEWDLAFHADKGVKLAQITMGDYNVYTYAEESYFTGSEDVEATAKFRVPYYSNGTYDLIVSVSDFAGNTTSETRTVIIDKTLPEVTLNVSDNSSYYYFCGSLQSTSWMRDMALIIDEDTELSWRNINNASDNNYSTDLSVNIDKEDLPSGTHSVSFVARSFAGDLVESDSVEITIEKTVNTSAYGLGKTWKENGTLIRDSKTAYLWSFDTGTALETRKNMTYGNVEKIIVGIGGAKAAKFYVDMSGTTTFNDSKWTLEFWSKNESVSTSGSNLNVQIDNFIEANVYKNRSSDDSYLNGQYYYTDVYDEAVTEWYHCGQTSRTNRAEWHHYAYVSDGNCFKCYVDGILVYESTDNRVSPNKMTRIYVWMDENVYIDELRISATDRSEQELWDYVQYVKQNGLIPE